MFLPGLWQGVLVPTGMGVGSKSWDWLRRQEMPGPSWEPWGAHHPSGWRWGASSQGTEKWIEAISLCRSPLPAAVLPWKYWKWDGSATLAMPLQPQQHCSLKLQPGCDHSLLDPPDITPARPSWLRPFPTLLGTVNNGPAPTKGVPQAGLAALA